MWSLPSVTGSNERLLMKFAKSQNGAVLIVSLVFLLLLTLLASSSMQNATLQEKVAGTLGLGSTAFQAAEALLRTAEAQLLAPGFSQPECSSPAQCLPPAEALTLTHPVTHRLAGVTWVASPKGYFGIQRLGMTDDPAGGSTAQDEPGRQLPLYRITAIGIEGSMRTVLESVHTGERRIMWRQRQ